MNFKTKIDSKGLKIRWIAEQIGENYNSLRVYLHDEDRMPEDIRAKLKALLN